MVDRTQEDVIQDTRIGNAEQHIRELTDKLDALTRLVENQKAASTNIIDRLVAVRGRVQSIEDGLAHLGPLEQLAQFLENVRRGWK